MLVHQTVIWVKARPVLTRSEYMWQHEPCLYGWPEVNRPSQKPTANADTIWEIDQQSQQDGMHPTQKPVEIFTPDLLPHDSRRNLRRAVLGLLVQLIAAERQNRRCFTMEIEPTFA